MTAEPGSINDFASKAGVKFGHAKEDPKFKGNCGADGVCEGYNGYWLIDDAPKGAAVLTIASEFSGVKAELRTDQPGVVLYSCSWMDGSAILKSTQGLNDKQRVVKSSCVAIEAQDYPDGINRYVFSSSLSPSFLLERIIELTISTVPSGVALMPSSLDLARSTAGRARGPLVFSKRPGVRWGSR